MKDDVRGVKKGTDTPARVEALEDEFFMSLAIEEARQGELEGEVPVGCVVECGGRVVAGAHNQPITLHDATAHAEILALRDACHRTENYRLSDATLYVTIEPCAMCAGAMIQARIKRVVYGAADRKAGALDSVFHLTADGKMNHPMEVAPGILEDQCRKLLQEFFAKRRT